MISRDLRDIQTQTDQWELHTLDPSIVENLEYEIQEQKSTISYLQAQIEKLQQDKYVIPIEQIKQMMNEETPDQSPNDGTVADNIKFLDTQLHDWINSHFSNSRDDSNKLMESLEKLTNICGTYNMEHSQMAWYRKLAEIAKQQQNQSLNDIYVNYCWQIAQRLGVDQPRQELMYKQNTNQTGQQTQTYILRTISIHSVRIDIRHGDLFEQKTDAFVIPQELELSLGPFRSKVETLCGQETMNEISQWRHPNNTYGQIVTTSAGNMDAKCLIFTFGPNRSIESQEKNEENLRSCIKASLQYAKEKSWKSISFPAIGWGHQGFPLVRWAQVFFQMISELLKNPQSISEVVLVNLDFVTAEIFAEEFENWVKKGDF